jgi:microfibrillar-associated protein 1
MNQSVIVRNEKGEISMQKVKVQRYISGKRPEYAQYDSSEEESDGEDFIDNKNKNSKIQIEREKYALDMIWKGFLLLNVNYSTYRRTIDADQDGELEIDDPRLRRLNRVRQDDERSVRHRNRFIQDPEILPSEEESEEEPIQIPDQTESRKTKLQLDSDESDTELSDTEIERRRQLLKDKMLKQKKEEEVLTKEEDQEGESESSELEESTEYEEESDEENEPRLKPLFVRKKDRTTIIEKEREIAKQKQRDYEVKKAAKERRRQTLRMVEESVKKEMEKQKTENEPNINDVVTDDENDEVEYESWKLRELKRIKRDREEKESNERENAEIERLRNLTEDERRQELRQNPKVITNKAAKGKYKFLQKYYHRGAFYLDNEDTVYKQDFSAPTLDDHFDKTILPKVMQVKNFGRCGRTKYTHLVDQDTTQYDSPWTVENSVS